MKTNKQHAEKIMAMVCETPFPAQSDIDLVEEYLNIMFAEKDKRIRELEEAAKSYIDKLEKELTSQLTEGVSLDVDGLNVALKKWSEVLTKINK